MKLTKGTYYTIIIFLCIAVLFTSCTEYLETNPDSRIEPKDTDDFKALITGAYPGAWYLFTELMTDNYRYYDYDDINSQTIVNWLKPMYLWSDNYLIDLPVGPEYAWGKYYHSIYLANIVLEGIDGAEGEFELNQSIKGEAYLVRAYAHFMLVNLFAKHYSPETASRDMGIPYVFETEKEAIKHYKRDNVAKVYQYIEDDIYTGLKLIDERYLDVPKFHFTKAAVYAFLTRYYLYAQKWQKCISYADSCLQINNTVRNLKEDYEEYFEENKYDEFASDYFSSDKDNILLLNKVLEWNSYPWNGFYANEFANEFQNDDIRGRLFVQRSNSSPNWHIKKFESQRKDGQQYSNVALFTVEEVLFNKAEAHTMLQQLNSAVEDINTVLRNRYEDYEDISLSYTPDEAASISQLVLNYLVAERRFEFCYEGLRWFDIKRFHIPVAHVTESDIYFLEEDDVRYALQIPKKELEANELMVPNPR